MNLWYLAVRHLSKMMQSAGLCQLSFKFGTPGWIRTTDVPSSRAMCWVRPGVLPLNYRSIKFGALTARSGGRLESRTLKALLTLDAFQVRSHLQLGWPSIILYYLKTFWSILRKLSLRIKNVLRSPIR